MHMPDARTRLSIPDLCARFGLGEQAAALARPEQDGPSFVDALIGAAEYPAALASALVARRLGAGVAVTPDDGTLAAT